MLPSDSAATPLGALWRGDRASFRVHAGPSARRVTLCLFDRPESARAAREIPLVPWDDGTEGVWRADLDDVRPGQLYGYRVDGPWDPERGLLYDPAKLLIDPWSRAVSGEPRADPALLSQARSRGLDSAGAMPKGVLIDPAFDWQGAAAPRTPWRDTVIYEAHVAGMTRLHPGVPPELRGTYLGLAQPAVIEHLKSLGVTAVELMPVHQAAPEAHLLAAGRRNYWGYSPVSFFAPSAAYARDPLGGQVREFQTLVREMHRAGLEVLVDVVFNHGAEGDVERGPCFGLKGFGARSFYRREGDRWVDWTGCGNTLEIRSPAVFESVLASLRYWAETLGVDGFRLDLATAVFREGGGEGDEFDPGARLFGAIARDPVLAPLKWIAEPWDLGPGGYRLGAFPAPWAEWNDRFRDAVRRFGRGEGSGGLSAELARRLVGSSDLMTAGRGPEASVHYVTVHDGFTLADLVSYERKRNLANGEDNRDGRDENLSRSWGQEGPSGDPRIVAARNRARRAMLALLGLARGVPMLGHGDELGRSQGGNNNAYCQDNEISWVHWPDPGAEEPEPLAFVRRLFGLRRRLSALRDWRQPALLRTAGGEPATPESLEGHGDKALMLRLPGEPELVLAMNAADHGVPFFLPEGRWRLELESAAGAFPGSPAAASTGQGIEVGALSVSLFSRRAPSEPRRG
ncbi:MAG: glycogen debranching protein GlgX [Acidobacteriota bacterium]